MTNHHLLLILLTTAVLGLPNHSLYAREPWASDPSKPAIKPYQLPLLQGDTDFHSAPTSLLPAPVLDPDTLYQAALDCYPEVSKFNIDVDLIAGYRQIISQYDTSELPAIGEQYIGIVGKMPLISASEDSRARDREYNRRTRTAAAVAGFAQAIADRNFAYRELGLYMALEARAMVRVNQGVAASDEQIGMMEKVAQTQRNLTQYSAAVVQHRLSLIAMCDQQQAPILNRYLKNIAALPVAP
jgi:hypothetical protein